MPSANSPVETTLITGTFTVTQVAGSSATVNMGPRIGIFGGMRFNNGPTYNFSSFQQNGADPPASFLALTLTPEPAGLGLLGFAALVLIRRRRCPATRAA